MMSDIGFLLKVIEESMERHANQMLKELDLTVSQLRVLKYLREREHMSATQKEIERYLQVSHPTVVGIVQRLEGKGFVKTRFHGTDKRNKYVYLTEKETELFQKLKDTHMSMEHLLTKRMVPSQIQQLKELLEIVYENVK